MTSLESRLNGRSLQKGKNKDVRRRLPRSPPPTSTGGRYPPPLYPSLKSPFEGLGCHNSGRRIRRGALADEVVAKARAAVAATRGAKSEPKVERRDRPNSTGRGWRLQKVEIIIEAHIRAAGEEEEARDRAAATRRRRAETKRAERYETAWIERERTEAGRRGSYR